MNCNSCGSTNLIEGTIKDFNDSGKQALFTPKDTPFYKKVFGAGGSKILSYACVHCGSLQFLVNFSDKEKAQYIEFEGKQPCLLERIGDDAEQAK